MPKFFHERCEVCGELCKYVAWALDEEFVENHPMELESNSIVCDGGLNVGCYKNFHKECFLKHICDAS